jgi:hypothetical protein
MARAFSDTALSTVKIPMLNWEAKWKLLMMLERDEAHGVVGS